ncbi:MAG: putative signal transducing protein [Thermodesulfovibrionales bacterium]
MDEEWVTVLITYDSLEAEMIKDLLESGGISVALRSSKVTPYPLSIGKMGEIKVMVRKEDKEIAEKVIEGVEEV